jgi:hypothetical protein
MKLNLVELGSASKETRDFSGAFAWDWLAYDFRRRPPVD